jgi:hypothetical protein
MFDTWQPRPPTSPENGLSRQEKEADLKKEKNRDEKAFVITAARERNKQREDEMHLVSNDGCCKASATGTLHASVFSGQ